VPLCSVYEPSSSERMMWHGGLPECSFYYYAHSHTCESIKLAQFVRLFVRMKRFENSETDFHEILDWEFLLKSVNMCQVWLKSEKTYGQFT
jgi:hypothetical protein